MNAIVISAGLHLAVQTLAVQTLAARTLVGQIRARRIGGMQERMHCWSWRG
jgi:hypothetical protein